MSLPTRNRQEDRSLWLEWMRRIADPVLTSLAARRLRADMPVESRGTDRADYTYLEAFGRLLAGMAPWLESGPDDDSPEARWREQYGELARLGIDAGTDPESPDCFNFTQGYQPIVDAAFLAHALLRAPTELYGRLSGQVQRRLVKSLQATRSRKPHFNNWLLFAAMIEAALYRMDECWDPMRIDYALKQHEQWYKGDGIYGDGPDFHWDYYNSFVIQPMLIDIVGTVAQESDDWKRLQEKVEARAVRYAAIQERSISPEGTFPVVGRSLAYRCGAFQHLAQMALQHKLPPDLHPAQVRCALTAVIRRTLTVPGTFDDKGWLQIGLCGHQPELGESYISTGSLYLCSTVFLPLGLPPSDPFWQGEADWTAKKAWSGQSVPIDQALSR